MSIENELSFWSNRHGSKGDLGVFKTAAELRDAGVADHVIGVSTGSDLLDALSREPTNSVDHVVIAGHGGTRWIIDDEHGVIVGQPMHRGQVSIVDVGRELARILDGEEPVISLAACMCSRSPLPVLRRLGRMGSDWGRRAYEPGGEQSFSAWLRDVCVAHGQDVRVRGHRASGHATALALLAEHRGDIGAPCETLFGRSLGVLDVSPTLLVRRWWTRHVTGRLAQRWLMGDDGVPMEVRALWRDSRG